MGGDIDDQSRKAHSESRQRWREVIFAWISLSKRQNEATFCKMQSLFAQGLAFRLVRSRQQNEANLHACFTMLDSVLAGFGHRLQRPWFRLIRPPRYSRVQCRSHGGELSQRRKARQSLVKSMRSAENTTQGTVVNPCGLDERAEARLNLIIHNSVRILSRVAEGKAL